MRHPEFKDIRPLVWEALNGYGRTIPDTGTGQIGNAGQQTFKDSPIWHIKPEIDEFVAKRMNVSLKDYGDDLSLNPLYKQIANEIGRLRRDRILIDWHTIRSRNTGTGIWRLDKAKLEQYALKRADREIKNGDFRAHGRETMIHVRTKQAAFRRILLKQYEKCMFCGFTPERYVVGAHIVPYAVMQQEDTENAMNPGNGLLLCKLCDVAFEHGSIMLEKDLGVIKSSALNDEKNEAVRSWTGNIVSQIKIRDSVKHKPLPKYILWKKELVGYRRPIAL